MGPVEGWHVIAWVTLPVWGWLLFCTATIMRDEYRKGTLGDWLFEKAVYTAITVIVMFLLWLYVGGVMDEGSDVNRYQCDTPGNQRPALCP
jgi:hypothetical protein